MPLFDLFWLLPNNIDYQVAVKLLSLWTFWYLVSNPLGCSNIQFGALNMTSCWIFLFWRLWKCLRAFCQLRVFLTTNILVSLFTCKKQIKYGVKYVTYKTYHASSEEHQAVELKILHSKWTTSIMTLQIF